MPTMLEPIAPTPESRLAARLNAIETRLSALERSQGGFPVVAGAPTQASADGLGSVDSTNIRLWLRINGAWRYVALT